MRILHVCPFFIPSEGGSERAVYYIAKETSKLGFSNTVATLNTMAYCVPSCDNDFDFFRLPKRFLAYRSAKLPEEEWIDGVRVARFPYVGLGYSRERIARVFSPQMISYVASNILRYSVVHFHTIGFIEMPYYISRICLKKDVPYIVQVHGLHEFHEIFFRLNPLFKLVVKGMIQSYLNNAKRIIAITNADLEVLSKFAVDLRKVRVVSYGIDPEKFKGTAEGFSRELQNRLKIKFVGTIAPNKGLEILIEALAAMEKDMLSKVEIDLVGDTTRFPLYFQRISKLIEENELWNVRFCGQKDHEKLVDEYSSADIFVFPSTSDSFGIVNIEAMASGVPVIATDVGGVREYIKHGLTGIIVPKNDPESLKEAIEKLIDDPSLRIKLARNGQKYVWKNYSWAKVAGDIAKIYNEIMR